MRNMLYVSDLPKEQKLEIYKQVRGLCIYEEYPFNVTMRGVLDSKVKDILPIAGYCEGVDYMEVYKDYSYGRC